MFENGVSASDRRRCGLAATQDDLDDFLAKKIHEVYKVNIYLCDLGFWFKSWQDSCCRITAHTTPDAGKGPQGNRNVLEQSGTVPADRVKEKFNDPDEHNIHHN
eukprot:14759826-Heterocapsa_arctica.AAC.1